MRLLRAALIVSCALGSLLGCTAPDEFVRYYCDPDAFRPDKYCAEQLADAGPDASDEDASADANAVQGCAGRCLPEPSSESAGDWPNTPLLLWVGPKDEMPASCNGPEFPGEQLFEKYRRYMGLIAPPAACEPCSCEEPEGTCAGLPASIEIRTTYCDQSGGETIPFNDPAGWDGLCTNENALPAGAMCNGVPCAQYVGASALPGPTGESCALTTKTPAFTKETDWKLAGLACEAKELSGACEPSTWRCMTDRPYPWHQCVHLKGVHLQCPGNYTYARFVMYGEEPIDDRGCSECSCGAPEGSYCQGLLRLYDDQACSIDGNVLTLASTGNSCGTIMPNGRAVGSKAITDLTYVPGTCAASGGAPVGEASESDAEAVTFCCYPPFDIIK